MSEIKKRHIPLMILIVATLMSSIYVMDTAKTNNEIVSKLEIKEIQTKKKIDSLRRENIIKDIIIFDSVSVDTILELETIEEN